MGTLKVIGSALYQWEIGRKIRVNVSVGNRAIAVQFAHLGDEEALSVIPKEENGIIVAEVPNIMLQSADKLIVFLVEMDENCVETTRHSVFHVVNRPKPADYIYTETEVLNYTYLDNRLKELEGDGLAKAVADYLKDNPVQAGATKEEAAQIRQNKTDIEELEKNKLDASKLPEAVNDALAQAKASGEFNGDPGEPGKTPVKGEDYFTDADKQEIAEQAAEMVEIPEGGSGLSETAKTLLITILRNGVYNTDQSANITALATEFGVAEEEPDVPDVPDVPVEPDEPPHTHSYTSSVTTAATCETAGVRTYTCSCGHSYTEVIPATGHNYEDGVCTNCGAADPDADMGGVDWVSGAEIAYTVVADEYVNASTGAFVPEPGGYDRTDYIYCYGAGSVYFNGSQTKYAAFYDINKQYIKGFGISGVNGLYANVPENAAYFAISVSSFDNAVIKIYKKVEPTWTDGVAYNFTFVEDEYVSKGEFNDYSGWKRTDYTNCAGASKLTRTNEGSTLNYSAFYNAEKEFIDKQCNIPANANGTVTIPAGACYFVISGANAEMDALVLVPNA